MTRDELNKHIREIEIYGNVNGIDLKDVYSWLEDIRDNGITDQKYTVQVIKNDQGGYLNAGQDGYELLDKSETDYYQTQFTQEEIKAMKKSPELAIDWDKAVIKPMEDK